MKRINYGWVVVGVGLLVNMTGLGFGRFAYPMLIPNMKGSLGLHYVEIGLLSGAIMLGYLLFSLLGGMLASRFGPKRIVISSLLCSAISMFFIGRLSAFIPLLIFTFAMGAGAAGTHISITTLPMTWFDESQLGKALGLMTGGTGLGIVLTGLMLPYILLKFGAEGWRQCWLFLSLLTFLVAVTAWILLREKKDQSIAQPSSRWEDEIRIPVAKKSSGLALKTIFVTYFIFGFSYNIFATYFVAYMVDDLKLAQKTAGDVWAIFGWMCMGSGVLWGFISDRIGRRQALIWNNAIIALSTLLPLLLRRPLFLVFSAVLFGGTFLGTVIIIASAIGDQVVEKRASVYGCLTLIHGIGQLLGTMLGGYLKDLTGAFQSSLVAALAGFFLCLIVTAFNKKEAA